MTGRGTKAAGAVLAIAGSSLYFVELGGRGHNLHWFVIPAVVLMGVGALFTMFGAIDD
jgi:hypothetical protein